MGDNDSTRATVDHRAPLGTGGLTETPSTTPFPRQVRPDWVTTFERDRRKRKTLRERLALRKRRASGS